MTVERCLDLLPQAISYFANVEVCLCYPIYTWVSSCPFDSEARIPRTRKILISQNESSNVSCKWRSLSDLICDGG